MAARKGILIGADKLENQLLELAKRVNDQAVEDLFYAALEPTESAAKRNAPTNDQIRSMALSTALFGSERRKLGYMLEVNEVKPGMNEIKQSIHREKSRFVSPRAFVAAHYRKAHHIFWTEYGRFNFPAIPFMRPAIRSTKNAVKKAVETGLFKLVKQERPDFKQERRLEDVFGEGVINTEALKKLFP